MMIIYKTTNLCNNKIYVGRHTIKNFYDYYLGSGTLIKNAINKYGRENFIRETLEIVTEDTCEDREQYWIEKLDSRNLNIGYNLSIGGLGGRTGYKFTQSQLEYLKKRARRGIENHMFGKHLSDYAKLCSSKANKGKKLSLETKIKIGNAGRGRKHTKETKQKLSDLFKQPLIANGILYSSKNEFFEKTKRSRAFLNRRILSDDFKNYYLIK